MNSLLRRLAGPLLLALLVGARPAHAQRRAGARRPAARVRRPPPPPPLPEPAVGMVITRSTRFRPGSYRLDAPASPDSAVLTVRGDDVTVDLTDVVLVGAPIGGDPDAAHGVAIRVEGGTRVEIRGARIRGYKVAILASGTRGLTLAGNDLSDNWRPRLYSLVEHESLADWLSFHHNEQDEWLRYGAGAYLRDVKGGEIRENRVERGMNGVLLVRSDSLRVWGNMLSYDSGLGLGLYRSSDNLIMHNRADYDVRGYSEGFYHRGQDSAALLLFEQSARNVVAFNSMTHGGDGFFLWAGQTTMDTGAGGANDNLVVGNDFSFAPANGIEATFSRNRFVDNLVEGSDYGVWGGYSHETLLLGNRFVRNRIGVAIEHGQDNRIIGNRFDGDTTAIALWADPIAASDWGYPKRRDTRSRDYTLRGNRIAEARIGLSVRNTLRVRRTDDEVAAATRDSIGADADSVTESATLTLTADSARSRPMPSWVADSVRRLSPPRIAGAFLPPSAEGRRPRSTIIVDEWGPYDFRYPKLWPADSTRALPLRLQLLGPPGRWRVVASRNVASLSDSAGATPDTIQITPSVARDWDVTMEFRGAPTISPRGEERPAGEPVRFGYGRFEPAIAWAVRFRMWSDSTDPRTHADAFARLVAAPGAVVTATPPRLDYEWYRPTVAGLPLERWGLEARGTVTLDSSSAYTLRAISDDGVRVWVDGQLAIDHWAPHESAVDEVALAPGSHELRVQYYQVDGWTELRVEVLRAPAAATGAAPASPTR